MKFRIQFQVGHTPITIEDEAQDTKEFFQKAAFVHSLPKSCGHCGKDDIIFEHRIVQSYEFFEIRCLDPDCNHVLRYGQYKNNGQLFAKRWEVRQFTPAMDGQVPNTTGMPAEGRVRPASPNGD